MNPSIAGVLWCLAFVLLEAIQSVFFGGVFQRMDSFLVGCLVFAITTVGSLLWTAVTAPTELTNALRNLPTLVGANVTAALSWVAYLLSIQMIEPAVAYTIFSGAIPLTTILAARFAVPEADGVRNSIEALGNAILLGGLLILAVATIAGWSGFVRGGVEVAVVGIALAFASGIIITWMLFFCRRLDRAGVGPVAQFGLRFILYVMVAGAGALLGLDHKEAVPHSEIAVAVLIGLGIMALPIYAVQKAISLVSPLTIGAIGALGPLLIFLFQLIEGRVDYATATLVGLAVYCVGALLAALSATSAAAQAKPLATDA